MPICIPLLTMEIAFYKVVPRSFGFFFLLPGNFHRPTCASEIKPTIVPCQATEPSTLIGQHELHKNEEEALKVLSLGPLDFVGSPFPLNDLH